METFEDDLEGWSGIDSVEDHPLRSMSLASLIFVAR